MLRVVSLWSESHRTSLHHNRLSPQCRNVPLAGMLAQDGRCKTLDAAADGYVRSETCIVVFMDLLNGDQDSPFLVCNIILKGTFVNQVIFNDMHI